MDDEKIRLMKDLTDDVFITELNSMNTDLKNFTKQRKHLEKVIHNFVKGYELTKAVQIEARKNPKRLQPVFAFEADEGWQKANAELANHKQDIELQDIEGQLDQLKPQLEHCVTEIERLESTLVEFNKEKELRGI